MLIMSFIPCADLEECGDIRQSNISSASKDGHHKHNHETEACSPFCICACCGQFFTQNIQLSYSNILHKHSIETIQYLYKNELIPYSLLDAIWQPPKTEVL
jgi:hypothetical protein